MALTWPHRRSESPSESQPVAAGFAEVPGEAEAYNFRSQAWERRGDEQDRRVTLAAISGRLGSVTRECREQSAAENLLAWLTGRLSQEVCPESRHTTLFRTSQLTHASLWIDRQLDDVAANSYATAVEEAQTRSSWLSSLRIPARSRYLAALDKAVNDVLASQIAPQQALNEVAVRWNEITDSVGRLQQHRPTC